MNTVKVNKGDLLTALRNNLERHKAKYDEAMKDRREHAIAEMTELLAHLEMQTCQLPSSVQFPKPDNYSAEYERTIKMVEMSVDAVIELTTQQFDQFVMDNWVWKNEFLRTSAMYAKGQ